jgi:hypothetical protein
MGPPLPKKRLGVVIGGRSAETTSSLEVFVDFTCPFSKRMYSTLKEVQPLYKGKVEFVMMPMPQPWHPSSAVVHEAYHAAVMCKPDAEEALFDLTFDIALVRFADVPSLDKSRSQMHKELADIYAAQGIDKATFLANLTLPEGENLNPGVPATTNLKLYVKAARLLGMHVTPSIRLNSIACDSSSSWTLQEWRDFLDPII